MPRRVTYLLHLLFFASGFAALIYQVAWVRVLKVSFGTTVYAVSTVLTVFMAGLALGSYLFGRWIDRGPHPLRVYAGLEFGMGAYAVGFALGLPYLHEFTAGLLSARVLPYEYATLVKFAVALIVLLPPTVLMGATLPVLGKYVTESSDSAGLRLGSLYGVNTLGAVLGCTAVAFVLIPTLGVSGSILFAAAVNVGLGVGSLAMSMRFADPGSGGRAPANALRIAPTAPERDRGLPPRRLLHVIAFASGFLTLATEVLWTRLFINLLTANVLVFAVILAAFLTGIALGSLLVARWVDRLERLDVALGAILVLDAVCLMGSFAGQGLVGGVFAWLHQLTVPLSATAALATLLAAMFVLVAVPATALGAVFPLLFRWSSRSLATLGSDTGRLYAANTVGSIAGSFLSGFVMIPALGLNTSLLVLGAGYGLSAWSVSRHTPLRIAAIVLGAVALGAVALPSVRSPIYWMNYGFGGLARIAPEDTVFLGEGVEGTVGVARSGQNLTLSVDGVIVAETSRAELWDLLLKAHLPMMMHEDPKKVALVGLGAGVSLGAVEAYDVERIDCVEISSQVARANRLFGAVNDRCWEDPRLHLWIEDGRHFLLTTDQRYDVISVDPIDPPVVYQYTQDFIEVCHDRLEPGGLMVQWVPLFHLTAQHLRVIMQAFRGAFPETSVWYDGSSMLLVGRKGGPLAVDAERFAERLKQPRVQASLKRIGTPDAGLLLSTYVTGPEGLDRLIGAGVPPNTDDFPYLEYAVLRDGRLGWSDFADNLELLLDAYEATGPPLAPASAGAATDQELRRARGLMRDLLQLRIHRLRQEEADAKRLSARIGRRYGLTQEHWKQLQPFIR